MRKIATILVVVMMGLVGCSRNASDEKISTPLTVDDWRIMPAEDKFTHQAMERLKLGDTKFQDDAEWDRFAQSVFFPAQRKEMPSRSTK